MCCKGRREGQVVRTLSLSHLVLVNRLTDDYLNIKPHSVNRVVKRPLNVNQVQMLFSAFT